MLNYAVIDLNKLKNNALSVKRKLRKGVKFCAVVKADAYGHGAETVANALYSVVDCFAVALVEEGERLRLSGIDKDILVLTPVKKQDIDCAVKYNLTLTVDNLKEFRAIENKGREYKKTVKVHIKVNTGMNRHGANIEELDKLLRFAKDKKFVNIEGIYSHFCNPISDRDRRKAVDKFLIAIRVAKEYNRDIICHISASGGFLKGEQFDMVRIGLLLYGYKPFASETVNVKPVMNVYAPLLKKREIGFGKSALYGRCRTFSKKHIAIVRYGYADGLPRKKVKGQFNNRCMDVTALTDIKRTKRGVEILGNADDLSKKYKTISYEILTKCALRAEKVYKR